MSQFVNFVLTPAGLRDPTLAIAACRAGGIGVVNGELEWRSESVRSELDVVAAHVTTSYGVKVQAIDEGLAEALGTHAKRRLRWLILDWEQVPSHTTLMAGLWAAG